MLVVCSLNVPRVDLLLGGSIILTVPYWKYCLGLGRRHTCRTRDVRYEMWTGYFIPFSAFLPEILGNTCTLSLAYHRKICSAKIDESTALEPTVELWIVTVHVHVIYLGSGDSFLDSSSHHHLLELKTHTK